MSASVTSPIATAQALALVKGPSAGVSGMAAAPVLRVLDDKATIPVGAPSVSTTDYIRFGMLKKGCKLIPALCRLTTNHTAKIDGNLTLVPLSPDGSLQLSVNATVHLETVAVSGNAENVETGSIPDNADGLVASSDSWVQFSPSSDLTIASTAKTIWARIVYASPE